MCAERTQLPTAGVVGYNERSCAAPVAQLLTAGAAGAPNEANWSATAGVPARRPVAQSPTAGAWQLGGLI